MQVLAEVTDRAGRSRWKLSDPVRWMLKGAGVMLAVGLVVALCLGAWILYVRSLHGQMAYEYIQQVIAQQQAQQKSVPPTK
jgi:hypothetical protein